MKLGVEKPGVDAEKIEEEHVKDYFENLGITESSLDEKKVVDIGAGARLLAGYAVRKGINSKIYSVEPDLANIAPEQKAVTEKLWSAETKSQVDSRTVKAVREALPFADESFDLALVNAALPGTDEFADKDFDKMKKVIDKAFNEYVRILKHGGEARIAPFFGEDCLEWRKPWKEEIDRKLAQLKKRDDLEVEIEEIGKGVISPIDPEETYLRIIVRKLEIINF